MVYGVAIRYTSCMTTAPELSTREARDKLADVVDDARHGEATVITSRGRRVAAVVPVDMLDEYEHLAEAADLAVIRERMDRVDAGEPTVPLADVMAETLQRKE